MTDLTRKAGDPLGVVVEVTADYTRPKVRLLHDHDEGCSHHRWVLLGEPIKDSDFDAANHRPGVERRDALGRHNRWAWRRWLTVRCNRFECPAVAIVSEEWLLGMIEAELPVPERGTP